MTFLSTRPTFAFQTSALRLWAFIVVVFRWKLVGITAVLIDDAVKPSNLRLKIGDGYKLL